MLRKIIFFAFVLMLSISICYASEESHNIPDQPKVIGIFLEAPPTYADNETARKTIPDKAREKFPTSSFKILPFEETELALRTYKEDNRMIVNQYYSQPVNRNDIQKISKEIGCDYALFITISNGVPRVSSGLFSTTFRTTVTCDLRLLKIEDGKYIINKQIIKDGQSTAVYAGVPSFNRAYNEALEKALSEIEIDITKL